MKSVLVIGGGLVGAASALRLQAAGIATTLVDPGDPRRSASFGNAGCIATEQVEPWASWKNVSGAAGRLFAFGGALDFRLSDVGRWLPWSMRYLAACERARFERGRAALAALLAEALPAWQRIAALAGVPDLVQADGHAVVWMSPRAAEAGRAAWEGTPTGSARFRDMRDDDLAAYAQAIGRAPAGGILFSGTGQVGSPQGARDAILAAFQQRGGESAPGRVVRLDGPRATLEGGRVLEADAALVAAGAWSAPLMRQLGHEAPLIGERGYSIESAHHGWSDNLPATVFEERALVLVRFATGLRATSFLEFGSPDAPGDPRKWATLERHVQELGISFDPQPSRWVGPRPTLPDYLPAIGRAADSRVLYAFGHQHLGLTLAAVTSELVAALATEAPPPVDISPFRIERFSA
ncbi:MAG: FAD-binding oxidoreductase [Hyphomonadaceae bacterium]|nr:FAD-binding oxidoreductase [Hyphomonadaceae bacterium]